MRYERERPSEPVRVNVKKAARIPDGAAGVRGAPPPPRTQIRVGYACLHVAVDDFSHVACAEFLPDERKRTCSEFIARRLAFFTEYGVAAERAMTDNGPSRRSREFNTLLTAEDVHHLARGPETPGETARSSG